jgi:serine/threonine protein phosphatase PrpC
MSGLEATVWEDGVHAPERQGQYFLYSVGDPGRAPAGVVPVADLTWPERPDTVVDGFSLTGSDGEEVMRIRAASMRGLSHRWSGQVRQDDYGWRVTEDGRYLVVCVADGVSSGPLSHVAAVRAARFGTSHVSRWLMCCAPSELPWNQLLADVARDIVMTGMPMLWPEVGDPEAVPVNDVAEQMATTALFAIVDLRAVDGVHDATLVPVGDSSAWVLTEGGCWTPRQPVKNAGAELHSTSVFALPLVPTCVVEPIRTSVRAGEALVLMTDGVGDPLASGSGEVGQFLADVWRLPPADLEFAAQVGFMRKTFDDDRTAFAIWPVDTSQGSDRSASY